jgi:hypothetical protein
VQLTPRLVIGLVAFGLAMTGIGAANLVMFRMIDEINRKRPEGEQMSHLGGPPLKTYRILDEYRRLYPAGRLHLYYWGSGAFAMINLVGSAVCGGIIR